MRYLPSLGVGNTQLIKGGKKGGLLISNPFPKKKKKKKERKKKKRKPNLRLNTVTQRRGNWQQQEQR